MVVANTLRENVTQCGNVVVVKYSNGVRVRVALHAEYQDVSVIIPMILAERYADPQNHLPTILHRHFDRSFPVGQVELPGIAVILTQSLPVIPIIAVAMRKAA